MEKLLQKKDDEIKELSEKVRAATRVVDEHQDMFAEVLMLRAREEEHAAVRARLDRATQRLEELAELRTALQASKKEAKDASRERDVLLQELGQMKGISQQLDAWKAKVRELELRCKDAESKHHSAEVRANECGAAEAALRSERAMFEDQWREAHLQLTFLKERGSCFEEGVIEPFTDELRDKMLRLEARNADLEEQLSTESAQRVAQLVVEVESLRGLKEHFESQHGEACAALRRAEESLTKVKVELADACLTKAELESAVRVLEEAVGRLEDERDDALDILEGQKEQLQAMTESNDKYRRNLEQSSEELGASRALARRFQERCSELDRKEQRHQRTVKELQRRSDGVHLSGALQVRAQADMKERDEVWAQRQGVLEEGFRDLRSGFLEQVKYNEGLKEQAEAAEARCGRLEESLRRIAPDELEVLSSCRDRRHQALPVPGAEYDLVRARRDNRRLQAQLAEQRLKAAQESQQVAQLSAQLRRLQRSLDLGASTPSRGAVLASDDASGSTGTRIAFASEQTEACAPESPGNSPARPPLRVLQPQVPRAFEAACRGADGPAAPAAAEKQRGPSSSILKKPKLLEISAVPEAPLRKENLGAARFATLPSKPVHRAPRAGLLA